MHVLVTGGAGYIGTVLTRRLLAEGHVVTVVDCGLFGIDHLPPETSVIAADIRDWQDAWLQGVDALIHLAGISNDPMADLSPRLNYEVNAAATALVAQSAKRCGVPRLIMASSCSVYGFSEQSELAEDAPTAPAFAYGISKLMAERALQALADDSFRPIIFRKGTVIGQSPRMRYDLAVNTMLMNALTNGEVTIRNPTTWRPLIDVSDVSDAYVQALHADPAVAGIYNIAHTNYTMAGLAEEVTSALADLGVDVSATYNDLPEPRSYRVSTRRARSELGFAPSIAVRESLSTMLKAVRSGEMSDLKDPRYHNVDWMKLHILDLQPR